MTLYQIKPAFQALLRPLMFWLHKKGVTANHVTLAAMALSFVTGAVLVIFPQPEFFVLLPIVLFIRMALNALDLGPFLMKAETFFPTLRFTCRLCCSPTVTYYWFW